MKAAPRLANLGVLGVLALLIVAGCGGGGGGGSSPTPPPGDPPTPMNPMSPMNPTGPLPPPGGDPPGMPTPPPGDPMPGTPDTQAPQAQIMFPPTATVTQENSVLVRGTASDNGTITAVRVNGIDATSSDGFRTWLARVPLARGRNALTVEATDGGANRSAAVAPTLVTHTAVIFQAGAIAVDTSRNRALVIDRGQNSVIAMDLTSGARTLLSRDLQTLDFRLRDIAIDTAGARALVLSNNGIMAVNLATGANSVLPTSGIPSDLRGSPAGIVVDAARNRALITTSAESGSLDALDLATGVLTRLVRNLGDPTAVAVDVDRNRALVLDNSTRAVIAVNLDTNTPSVFSSSVVPDRNTPFLSNLFRIVVDSARNRALVLQNRFSVTEYSVVAVDLTTGSRQVFADPTDAGLPLRFPDGIALDASQGRLLVTDANQSTVVAANLINGVRTVLTDTTLSIPANAFSESIFNVNIALDAANARAFITDNGKNALIRLNLNDGSTQIVSDATTPNNLNPLSAPLGLALDPARNRAFVANRGTNSILAVDLRDGARTPFADSSTPTFTSPNTPSTPVAFEEPASLALDLDNNRLFELTEGLIRSAAILTVDLTTGSRTLFSSELASLPDRTNPFGTTTSLVLDSANNRILVADTGISGGTARILAVSLVNGARTVLSSGNIPNTTNPLNNPRGIALDRPRNRLLALESGRRRLVAVDLQNGSRTIVAEDGSANRFIFPRSLALDEAKAVALVADAARVRVIDVITGERVFY